jgi:hypothetical protein
MEEISTMSIADKTGDKKVTWRRRVFRRKSKDGKLSPRKEAPIVKEPEDERQARLLFEKAKREGKDIYKYKVPGNIHTAEKMYEWDPIAKFISIEPPLSRGK